MSQRFLIEVNTDFMDELPVEIQKMIETYSYPDQHEPRGMKIIWIKHHMTMCPVDFYKSSLSQAMGES